MANLDAIAVALNSLSRGAISSSSEKEALENFLEDFFAGLNIHSEDSGKENNSNSNNNNKIIIME